MSKTVIKQKGKTKVTVLKTLAVIFLVFQLIGYINSITVVETFMSSSERIGYYIGFNFSLYIAIGFYLWYRSARKEMKNNQKAQLIDAIGKDDVA